MINIYFILIEVNILYNSCLINLKHIAYVRNSVAICSLKLIVLKTNYPTILLCINKYREVLKAFFTCFKNWNYIK